MKTLHFTLAGALRQMLDESGLNQDQFAEAADISKGSVTNYIKSRTVPRWTTVQRWAEVCGYDPDSQSLRELWEAARMSGWVYEATLLDLIDAEVGDDVTVVPFRTLPAIPAPRSKPMPRKDAA